MNVDTNDGQAPETRSKISPKKCDQIPEVETQVQKPRIVLTFRSEKPGLKSSNMKIVSSEAKHDGTVRRTTGTQGDVSDAKDEETNGVDGKNLSTSDSTTPETLNTLKRSERAARNKIFNDFSESSTPTQRLSRRIKPTAKILANKELRMGLETQNNARLGITTNSDKSPEESVQTLRRSARRRSMESHTSDDSSKILSTTEPLSKKKKVQMEDLEVKSQKEATSQDQELKRLNKMKKKHLSKLGLQAIDGEATKNSTEDSTSNDTIVPKKKLKEDACAQESEDADDIADEDEFEEMSDEEVEDEAVSCPDDEEFTISSVSKSDIVGTRRSTRRHHTESRSSNHVDSGQDEPKDAPRRSTRLKYRVSSSDSETSDVELAEDNEPPKGDEGSEATCPDDNVEIIGTCLCEATSNVFAAASELEEPVFCRAIDTVDGGRVGCSNPASSEPDGSYSALRRAGPRTPYILTCTVHTAQLRKHMCCVSCGLFCSQGIFYQCSSGHLFHLECGLTPGANTLPGCPHCGVQMYRWWQPVNRDVCKVQVDMKCTNKRILLHEQRVQSSPAYLSFSKLEPSQLDLEPVIPEDLLPSPPIDVKKLRALPADPDYEELISGSPALKLREAITNFEAADQLIAKMANVDLNKSIVSGSTCLHLAAQCGNLTAVYLLQYSGADLNVLDDHMRTPLMLAIMALSDKSPKKQTEKSSTKSSPPKDTESEDTTEKEEDTNKDGDTKDDVVKRPVSEEDLLKVIRYLVAAGCDVNIAGPEDMTALHIAAQHGLDAVCSVLVRSAATDVDPRDLGGWTPLVWAAENNHADTVRLLLSAGAEAAAADGEGNAALHWCALAGSAAAMTLLLHAADTHAKHALNAHGDTPLHVAARQGHYPCVVILLARGARTDIENSAGELAVEVCSGECQKAISLNMQLAITVKGGDSKYKLLSADISNGRETYAVPCVNEVDDAPLPEDFTYITTHVMPENIVIDSSLPTTQGCSCSGAECGTSQECACTSLSVRRWWRRGKLTEQFPYHDPPVLFECNQTCACNMKQCPNLTITRASRLGAMLVRASVFRCEENRGWGLRALAPVPRGAPVAFYCGELLTVTQADARPTDHYMFALDLKTDLMEQCSDKTQLCVDAARYGSAARFINHSCRPNLAPVRVFTTTRDLRLPVIALFATRDIRPYEEFTFDYGDKFWSVKSKYMKCECGAPDCRYPTKQDESKTENA